MMNEADTELHGALATIAHLVPREQLIAMAGYLRALHAKKAFGGYDASMNMVAGEIRTVDHTVRDHWQPPKVDNRAEPQPFRRR